MRTPSHRPLAAHKAAALIAQATARRCMYVIARSLERLARRSSARMPPVNRVAVVGLGAMGSRIARRLLDGGNELVVWNRDPARATTLAELGATPAESPADAARGADVVVTMVSDPGALQAVTEGPDSVAAGADGRTTVIQMSTI